MSAIANDLRFGLRQLIKKPGFTLVCILTLALGIGANTAVFSVMNAVLLRSLPVADPSHVVLLRTSNAPSNTGTVDSNQTFSYSVYAALRQTPALSPLMAYVPLSTSKVAVRFSGQPEQAEGDMVSGTFFSGLGVRLALGSSFKQQDEDQHAPLAVLSYSYWTRRFAADPDVLGKTLYVNSVPITIIGVAAQGFEGVEAGRSTDFWIPLQSVPQLNAWGNPLEGGKTYINNPTWWCLRLIARVPAGVSRAQALAQLQPAFQRAAYVGLGTPKAGEKPPVLSLVDARSFSGYEEQYGKPLRVLMSMVGLVLLIALCNVIMLLVARNSARQREFSVRLALGAGRRQIFRQLMIESLLLVSAGTFLAWVLAGSAARALGAWAGIESTLAPDHTALLFTLTLLGLSAVLFGAVPLRLALSAGPAPALKTSAASANADTHKSRTGRILVVLQITLCVVLLVGGALLVQTLRNLQTTSLGMRVDGLVVFGVKPNIQSVPEGVAFYRALIDKLRALPGVESVTIMAERLGSWQSDNSDMLVDGKLPEVAGGGARTVRSNVAGPDFFKTLGVPMLLGRDFADSDTASSAPVGIINEQFAKKFFPNQNPLGHTIGPEDFPFKMRIVGVAKDHKYRSIDEEPIPMAWYMYAQIPITGQMHVEMRVAGNPLAILPAAQKVVQQFDQNLPLIQPTTQRAQFETTISRQMLFGRLAGCFGILAVMLVATGVYGTLAYRVANRTSEIGVRLAVGAQRRQMVWLILRESLQLTAAGAVFGVPLSFLLGRLLASSLYGVESTDALSYVLAIIGITCVAVAASVIPARRAASVDPMVALRTE